MPVFAGLKPVEVLILTYSPPERDRAGLFPVPYALRVFERVDEFRHERVVQRVESLRSREANQCDVIDVFDRDRRICCHLVQLSVIEDALRFPDLDAFDRAGREHARFQGDE